MFSFFSSKSSENDSPSDNATANDQSSSNVNPTMQTNLYLKNATNGMQKKRNIYETAENPHKKIIGDSILSKYQQDANLVKVFYGGDPIISDMSKFENINQTYPAKRWINNAIVAQRFPNRGRTMIELNNNLQFYRSLHLPLIISQTDDTQSQRNAIWMGSRQVDARQPNTVRYAANRGIVVGFKSLRQAAS